MVSKNLSTLRKRAGLTQDALAEKLHVTRQAVSNWETGKCQPDVETLTALSEAIGCEVTELIYGAKREPYRRYAPKYIVWTVVLVIMTILLIVGELKLLPYLYYMKGKTYLPQYTLFYYVVVRPIGVAAVGALVIAVLSLWVDLRLPKRVRIALLVVGVLCFLPFLPMIDMWLTRLVLPQTEQLHQISSWLLRYQLLQVISVVLPFIGGLSLFWSRNK